MAASEVATQNEERSVQAREETRSSEKFIRPATEISANRNGSRTLGIVLTHYREHRAQAVKNRRESSRSSFRAIRHYLGAV